MCPKPPYPNCTLLLNIGGWCTGVVTHLQLTGNGVQTCILSSDVRVPEPRHHAHHGVLGALELERTFARVEVLQSWRRPLAPLVRSDKYFVSSSTCNPTACSHWLTQSQKEADIYYLFIIG